MKNVAKIVVSNDYRDQALNRVDQWSSKLKNKESCLVEHSVTLPHLVQSTYSEPSKYD